MCSRTSSSPSPFFHFMFSSYRHFIRCWPPSSSCDMTWNLTRLLMSLLLLDALVINFFLFPILQLIIIHHHLLSTSVIIIGIRYHQTLMPGWRRLFHPLHLFYFVDDKTKLRYVSRRKRNIHKMKTNMKTWTFIIVNKLWVIFHKWKVIPAKDWKK